MNGIGIKIILDYNMNKLKDKINKLNVYSWEYFEQVSIFELKPYIEEIKNNPYYAYCYAVYVIKGRWHEAEDTIITSPKYAYYYAEDIIKDRWLEVEDIIKTDSCYWYYYKKRV